MLLRNVLTLINSSENFTVTQHNSFGTKISKSTKIIEGKEGHLDMPKWKGTYESDMNIYAIFQLI